tara:strand:- start:943 stop:3228 length:2286 start_codon:yes stop_codon:yes gene_type:complete
MIRRNFELKRKNKKVIINTDFVVIGGGLAGVCASIVAARDGINVVLIQDRPVLGGNASSEIRLWALGATSSMGNNNRWAREGGVINEILLENLKRNKEGNPLIFDTILIEKINDEKNIQLLLNTAVYGTEKADEKTIDCVKAFCSQNGTNYKIFASFFCDSSGDGIVAFQSGASFRMGAEHKKEFDEGFAPNIEDYGNLLGHSLYFYTKNVGKPVNFIAPSFAIKNAGELPRFRNYKINEHGCNLWWVEYGGRLDTIHQSEDIKFELWKVVYGIWDYVKNSGEYPESKNLTLEWVGTIPGKRESRRFVGDHILVQKDIVEQKDYYDRVSFGGWALDLHPADGIYSELNSCTQWHSKGVYSIPFRCYYSRDIDNLFLAGRIISSSHVAFGSSRVMLTCSHGAQAVGKAAAICLKKKWIPKILSEKDKIQTLQLALNKDGQSIPRTNLYDENDLILKADISASSELKIKELKSSEEWRNLSHNSALLIPLAAKVTYDFTFKVKSYRQTEFKIILKRSSNSNHFTPDLDIDSKVFKLNEGIQEINYIFSKQLSHDSYVYLCLIKNDKIDISFSSENYVGLLTLYQKETPAVSNYGRQVPPEDIGVESFDFWTPDKKFEKNLAVKIDPPIQNFSIQNLKGNCIRPTSDGFSNVWQAKLDESEPRVDFKWSKKQKITCLKLFFDCDYDNALPNVLVEHPYSEIPSIIKEYKIYDESFKLVYHKKNNYQAINKIKFNEPIYTNQLTIIFSKKLRDYPVAVFKVSAYS